MAGSSFVICTRNRPEELGRCLATIVQQTVPPEEVVIVDASDERDEATVRKILEEHGIRLLYLATQPGRTKQLNLGIRAATGDPLFFVDDDVELEPQFHEAMLDALKEGGEEVGGVQGTVIGDTLKPLPLRLFRAVFLLSRHTKNGRARLLPSGYYTTPARPTRLREAEALRLCGLAFRRKVFDEFMFDESLEGYALKEDVDFSYRVSRRYKLLIVPRARFRHYKTPSSRISVREKSRMHIVNNRRLFEKNLEGTWLQRLAFAWAMCGRVIYELLRTVVKREPGYLLGAIDGIREIARRSARA
jgi:GT2 family glycosyltransferase